jgi:serine/threonine protein kinase
MICEATELGVRIEVPRHFSKYTYVRTIGSAASSVVLLVTDPTGQQYAAKCVKRDFLICDSNFEYFEREVRLLQFIHHPNIVRLHDVVYQTDNIIVIMEFCELGDLFEELARNGAMSVRRLRSCIYQLLKALECLHGKGFAHRDLKPENILVCANGVLKIADLGLAQAVPANRMMTTLCGSVHYMAPEILQEIPYDGTKADMWSIGIIIFAMALNQLPWASRDNAELVREIVKAEIALPPHLIPEIAQIVTMCTKKNPKERPTPSEVLDVPWLSEEVVAYHRLCGLSGKLSIAALHEGQSKSLAKLTTAGGKSTARLILSKPSLRGTPSFLSEQPARVAAAGQNKG